MIIGSTTKWGFPTGTLHKPAAERVAAGDPLSYKYSKHLMWNRCIKIHNKTSWVSFLVRCNNITAALKPRLMGVQIDGRGLAEVCPRLGTGTGHPEEEEEEGGGRGGSGSPSGPAVTGLSQPRGKVTHRTAQRGPINVRPSRGAVVMADKRLSGSSRSQSTRDTCAALCSVLSEGIKPTRGGSSHYNPPDSQAETLPLSYSAFRTWKDARNTIQGIQRIKAG